MKHFAPLLTLLLALSLLAGCNKESVIEKNYADDFAGTYRIQYYPNVTATLPILGEQELNLGPISATARIVKDGDYGDVLFLMNGDTLTGICYKRGLKLEAQTDIKTLSVMGMSVSYSFYLLHPVIAAPTAGVMQWSSPTHGTLSAMGTTSDVEGTTRFVATRQ